MISSMRLSIIILKCENDSGFFAQINNPLLKQMKVRYVTENIDVGSLIEPTDDIYYKDSEVVVVGKLADSRFPQTVTARVTGKTVNGDASFTATRRRLDPQPCFPESKSVNVNGLSPFYSLIYTMKHTLLVDSTA